MMFGSVEGRVRWCKVGAIKVKRKSAGVEVRLEVAGVEVEVRLEVAGG